MNRAYAWGEAAATHRRRATALQGMEIRVRGSGHPAAQNFARFYAACADDETRAADFAMDVARACAEDADQLDRDHRESA